MAQPQIDIRVQTEDFDLAAMYAAVRAAAGADGGAVVAFTGLVRDRNAKAGDGHEVNTLTLEHYPGMTESSMQGIVSQAVERWPLLAVHVVHRVGELSPTEQIVAVVVASAHRDAAFAAAEFVMDYLKTDAVFWKKETSTAGTQWLEATGDDVDRSESWRGADASG